MKTVRNVLLMIVILGSLGYSGYVYLAGPCRTPIGYRLGEFDERFGVSREEFIAEAKKAEIAWEAAVGRDLFVYDEKGKMPINLMYDSRQATTDRNEIIEERIGETEESAETVKARFESLRIEYETKSREYDASLEAYKEAERSFNSNVSYWNEKGGAPKDEYNKILKRNAELARMFASLESERLEVNRLAEEVNGQIAAYNALIKKINSNIEVINESADKEFEQGEYISEGYDRSINIYEFKSEEELMRVLMHEFGHALGMGHNENPESIMYYLNSADGLVPSAEDVAEAKSVCEMKL